MASTIRIKKRAASGSAGAPSSLASSELAFNENDKKLYYGFGDDGSAGASSIITVGGNGAFCDLTTAQTVAGAKTFSDNVVVTGNLTVNGTTTTVNSTTTTVDDPVFTIGGDGSGSNDDKDRGIEFKWHNGSAAKVGFFGFDDSTGKFTFIPDATNSSEVFSGSAGTIVAALEGNADTATALATGRTIAMTGDVAWTSASFDGSGNVTGTSTIQADAVDMAMLNVSGTASSSTYLRGDGSWQAISGTDTTYSISCVDGDNNDEEKIRLTAGGDGSGTDDIVLEAGTGLSVARSGDKITFTNTVSDTNTTYSAGTGLSLSSTTFSLGNHSGDLITSGTVAADRVATLNQDTTGTAAIATTVTVADESSDTTCFPLFATAATGDLGAKSGSNLTFNSSSGLLTATQVDGLIDGGTF